MRIGFGSQSVRNFPANKRAAGLKLLLAAMALGFVAVAHAQPFPSFLLDTTRYIGRDLRVGGCRYALATSRTRGMVVWQGTAEQQGRANRLTRSMDLVDTIPMDVTGTLNGFSFVPAVACSDSGYAVTLWRSGAGQGLWLALVSLGGEVVNRVPVDTEVGDLYSLALACRSDRYALVCHGHYSASQVDEIRATEVALDGTTLRRYTVVRGGPMNPPVSAPDVARGDSAYFVVWQGQDSASENYDINARFIWPDNPSADTAIFSVRTGVHAFSPKTVFDGENFWVAWLEETSPYAETVAKVARVSERGVVLDTGGIVVKGGVKSIVMAAARETTLVALHLQGNAIVGMRYNADAQVLDSSLVLLSNNGGSPVAAVAADTFLVVWYDLVEGVSMGKARLAGRRITASGTVVDSGVRDYAFSASNHDADHVVDAPIIASDGEDFLVVWSDERADPDYSARLLGRRFDNQGRFLDAEPFTITDPYSTPLRPVLTYGAGCYFLCWRRGSTGPHAVRISPQGEVMDTVPIALPSSTGFSAFDVTFLCDSMFVILGGDTMTNFPLVVRVMADGRVIDSVPRIIRVKWAPGTVERYPSIASIGNTLVMACRLDSFGIPGLAVGLYDCELWQYVSTWWTTKPNYLAPWRTSVACGGGRILVGSDPRNRSAKPELWLLDSLGHLLNDSAIPNPCGWGNNFCIGYDGENFLCAKSGEGFTALPGSRISPDGEVLDKPAVLLAAFESTLVTGHCGLARDTLGNVGLVFFTFETEGYMSDRIRAAVFPRMTGGVEEACGVQIPRYRSQTVVRHVLMLPPGPMLSEYHMLDISGRRVMVLKPGANDVRGLAPGVYFVREARAQAQAVRKIVLTK
jgi:hypothetical protein